MSIIEASPGDDDIKGKALPMSTTLLLVNQFVLQTTGFLNTFASQVESKISDVSSRVTQLEILLSVLEAKIHSIPGAASGGTEAATNSTTTESSSGTTQPTTTSASSTNGSRPPPPPPPPGGTRPAAPQEQEEQNGEQAESNSEAVAIVDAPQGDPRFKKYEMMLKVGLPSIAVRLKMEGDGMSEEDISGFLEE